MTTQLSPSSYYQFPVGANIGGLNDPYVNPLYSSYEQQNSQNPTSGNSGVVSPNTILNLGSRALSSGTQAAAPVYQVLGTATEGVGSTAGSLPWSPQSGIGPMQSGAPSYNPASLGNAAAGVVGGVVGNMGANAIFGDDRGVGATVGGTAGAIAGQMLIPIPGVGAAIGSFLGNGIGGMFGNGKPSDKTQVGGYRLADATIDADYSSKWSAKGNKYDANNGTLRDSMQTGASGLSKFLLDNGATVKDPNNRLVTEVGSRDGYRYFFSTDDGSGNGQPGKEVRSETKNFGKDYTAYSNNMAKDIISQYNITPELQKKLDAMNFDDLGGLNKSQSGGIRQGMPIPMVAPRSKFADFMKNKGYGPLIMEQPKGNA